MKDWKAEAELIRACDNRRMEKQGRPYRLSTGGYMVCKSCGKFWTRCMGTCGKLKQPSGGIERVDQFHP